MTLRHARRGVALAHQGGRLVHLGWTGFQGGFAINADGIRPLRGISLELIRWGEVEVVQADLDGIAFSSEDGRSIVASPFAEGFWPVATWVDSRISKSGRINPLK